MAEVTQLPASWATLLGELHDRIAWHVARPEPRQRALSYLKALISTSERRNGWRIAEAVVEANPDGVQRLLGAVSWDARKVRDDLRGYVVEHLGDHGSGVSIVDETGFLKKGEKSIGMARRYSGTAEGVSNCQVGMFPCYTSSKGAAFLDRALYLPEHWTQDHGRGTQAGVPEELKFVTKPKLAVGMLARAFLEKVPTRWVTADSLHGSSHDLRLFLENRGQPFVLRVKSNDRVWKLPEERPLPVRVDDLAAEVPSEQWQRLSAGEGSKGESL